MDSDGQPAIDVRARVRESPFLRGFGGTFPDLTAAGSGDVGQTFERLGELVNAAPPAPAAGGRASISFVLEPGDAGRAWTLSVDAGHCEVSTGRADVPDLEVIVSEDTWGEIARGATLPLEAFGRGRMRVRGDVRLAQWLLDAVAQDR